MTTRLTRITISVASLDRARLLYQGVLHLPVLYESAGMVMLSVDDARVEIQLHERPPTAGDAGVAISFGVDDVDAVTESAVAAGATVVKHPADQEWGERQSVLRDADGHVFCLVSSLSD